MKSTRILTAAALGLALVPAVADARPALTKSQARAAALAWNAKDAARAAREAGTRNYLTSHAAVCRRVNSRTVDCTTTWMVATRTARLAQAHGGYRVVPGAKRWTSCENVIRVRARRVYALPSGLLCREALR